MESVQSWFSEKSLRHRHVLGMVDGQIQEIWKPRVGQPSRSHKNKLGVGLTQLGQDLGEELMRSKGISSHILPRQTEGFYR